MKKIELKEYESWVKEKLAYGIGVEEGIMNLPLNCHGSAGLFTKTNNQKQTTNSGELMLHQPAGIK